MTTQPSKEELAEVAQVLLESRNPGHEIACVHVAFWLKSLAEESDG